MGGRGLGTEHYTERTRDLLGIGESLVVCERFGVLVFELWTDGACSGHPGVGGWAAILIHKDGPRLAISGHEDSTTNNRMELAAVCEGLEAIGQQRAAVTIFTDSSYVKNAHTQGWLMQWQRNGWISSRGDLVANRDLWERLMPLTARHVIRWRHVKGHGTSVLNNLADAMAVEAKKTGIGVMELS